jgi:fimbrial chaperone protein
MKSFLRAAALASGLAAALPAWSAGMRVVPLRVDMTAKGGSASLEVTNLSPAPMGVQVEAKAWAQQAGADVYTPTTDLFFAPPIISIPAGKTKTIRFRLRRGAAAEQELAYRIYVEQLAAAPDAPRSEGVVASGVDVRLRMGIPLFVAAVKPQPPVLTLAAGTEVGNSVLKLANTGGTHLKVLRMEVRDAGGAVVAESGMATTQTNYLLPGNASVWPLRVPQQATPLRLSPGRYTVRLQTDFYSAKGQGGFGADGLLTQTVDLPP